MRGVTAVLVFLLAACSTAGGDTTTIAPLAEPSTTSTRAAPTTTTTEPTTTTTTTQDECVDPDGDGVLRHGRGFVCPPYLRTLAGGDQTDIHLPGEYRTRLFQPAVAFTRTGRFTSSGENSDEVVFDTFVKLGEIPDLQVFSIADHETAARIPTLQPWNHPQGWEWVTDLSVIDIEVGGFPATLTQFTANCPEPNDPDTELPLCLFEEPVSVGWSRRVFDGQWTAVVVVELPSGPFTIIAYEVYGKTDYWTTTVEPLLDSIEFIDQ